MLRLCGTRKAHQEFPAITLRDEVQGTRPQTWEDLHKVLKESELLDSSPTSEQDMYNKIDSTHEVSSNVRLRPV